MSDRDQLDIRAAESLQELQALRPLFKAFHELARLPGSYDVGVEQRLADLGDTAAVFSAYSGDVPVGVIGCVVSPDLFTGIQTASELFWYVVPEFRGGAASKLLFKAFEEFGAAMGARRFHMMALDHLDPERVGVIYRRKGYTRREILWEKLV